jgi:hypothetical protein
MNAPKPLTGPDFPDAEALWAAQAAPYDAWLACCSDAEYDRLVLERQQTEMAFREGCDREFVRRMEAAEAEPEAEPTPYELGITDDPELGWADVQPGEREFCAQAALSYPEHERRMGEAAAARMAELERQAAEVGLDVFGGPLPDAQAREPEAGL